MRGLKDLPAWERLFKKIVWKQLGDIKDKYILDFGSGEGITANYFAEKNRVVAVEPWEDMLKDAWTDNEYRQIIGDNQGERSGIKRDNRIFRFAVRPQGG